MATTDRSLLDLGIKPSANDDDTLVSVVSNKASRLTLGYIKNLISQWSNLKNKPFDWNELSHTRDFSHDQEKSKNSQHIQKCVCSGDNTSPNTNLTTGNP